MDNRPAVVPSQYQLKTFTSEETFNNAVAKALTSSDLSGMYNFAKTEGSLVNVVQGRLDGDTTGTYDPKTKTVTIDTRKLDRRNLEAGLVNNIGHEVRHFWQSAMIRKYGDNFITKFDSMIVGGKTQWNHWDRKINTSGTYEKRSHEIDAFFWGAKVMRETTGRIVDINGDIR